MSLVPQGDEARYEEMAEVVSLFVQNLKPAAIAKHMGIRKVDVDAHLEEWRKSAVGSDLMKERVEELITSMDEHYSILIGKAREVIDEVDNSFADANKGKGAMLAQKLGAIKTIQSLESDRIDILQKSGLLEAADLGDELAAMEEQKELLMTILDEELGPECRKRVMRRIRENASEFGGNVVVVQQ